MCSMSTSEVELVNFSRSDGFDPVERNGELTAETDGADGMLKLVYLESEGSGAQEYSVHFSSSVPDHEEETENLLQEVIVF